jgi:uncharacterized protein
MSVSDPLDAQCLSHIAAGLNLPLPSVRSVLTLLDEGSTVPFIARYRKEATGNLDEVQIRDVAEKVDYFRELLQRRETVLTSIAEQGKLTDDLKASILASMDRNQLEDLYLPYKPRRRTKATSARERGLEPLADYIWKQKPSSLDLIALTESLLDPAREVATVEAALEGARHIVAERISEDAEVRKAARHLMFEEGIIASRKALDAVDEQEKFKMYYEYREPVKTIPSHRMLRSAEAKPVTCCIGLLNLTSSEFSVSYVLV